MNPNVQAALNRATSLLNGVQTSQAIREVIAAVHLLIEDVNKHRDPKPGDPSASNPPRILPCPLCGSLTDQWQEVTCHSPVSVKCSNDACLLSLTFFPLDRWNRRSNNQRLREILREESDIIGRNEP